VVITKTDLLPHVPVSLARLEENVARVMPAAVTVPVSAQTGAGIEAWIGWLEARRWEAGTAPAHPHHHHEHGHDHDHEHGHDHHAHHHAEVTGR